MTRTVGCSPRAPLGSGYSRALAAAHGGAKRERSHGLTNTPAWKCWRADLEPRNWLASRSNLPSALEKKLKTKSASSDKQVGDVGYFYALVTQHVGLETLRLERNTHAERRREPRGIFTIGTRFLCEQEKQVEE